MRSSGVGSWIGPLVYGVVGAAGWVVVLRSGDLVGSAGSMIGFTAALVLLTGLDLVQARGELARRAHGSVAASPALPVALLVTRVALTVLVLMTDPSGAGRVVLLLVAFHAWTTLGPLVGALTAAGVFVALPTWLVVGPPPSGNTSEPGLGALVMFGLGLVLTCALAALSLRERALRSALEAALGEVAALAAEGERRRISREVHDSVGHHLTATAIQLERAAAFRGVDPTQADAALTHARNAVREALLEVRAAVRDVRSDGTPAPSPIELDQLRADLARLGGRLAGPALDVTVAVHGAGPVPPEVATAVRRVVQEGLTNVARHAAAHRVDVSVVAGPGEIGIEVHDDGHGFEGRAGSGGGLGLIGLRERVGALGGVLEIDSTPDGTVLRGRLPMAEVVTG